MAQNKKHHYVPRFYLKRFSCDGKNINLWNLASKKKVLSANLKNQCYKNYFYGKNPEAEAALGDVEQKAADLFRLIDRAGVPPPFSDWHLILIFYVLIQNARTAYMADALNEMTDKMMKHLYAERARAEGIDLSELTINLREPGLVSLAIAGESYPLLADLYYKLLANVTHVEFISSDNPVVFYNQLLSFRRFVSNTGLPSKGLQIFFPLGPKEVLLLFDATVYSVGNRKHSRVTISQPRDVYEINTLQMCSANENIYCTGG